MSADPVAVSGARLCRHPAQARRAAGRPGLRSAMQAAAERVDRVGPALLPAAPPLDSRRQPLRRGPQRRLTRCEQAGLQPRVRCWQSSIALRRLPPRPGRPGWPCDVAAERSARLSGPHNLTMKPELAPAPLCAPDSGRHRRGRCICQNITEHPVHFQGRESPDSACGAQPVSSTLSRGRSSRLIFPSACRRGASPASGTVGDSARVDPGNISPVQRPSARIASTPPTTAAATPKKIHKASQAPYLR